MRERLREQWVKLKSAGGEGMNWITIVLIVLAVIFVLFLLGVLEISPIVD